MNPDLRNTLRHNAEHFGFDPDYLLDLARKLGVEVPSSVDDLVDGHVTDMVAAKICNREIAALHVANFKAFGPKVQRIPLAPITLVFGPNSAGKSSLMQALLYASHVQATGELSVKHPKKGGTVVDLGGFANIQHRRQRENSIILGFEFAHHFRKLGDDAKPAIWWVTIGHAPGSSGRLSILRAELEIDGQCYLSVHRSVHRDSHHIELNHQHTRVWSRLTNFATDHLGLDPAPAEIATDIEKYPVIQAEAYAALTNPFADLFDSCHPHTSVVFGNLVPGPVDLPTTTKEFDEWETKWLTKSHVITGPARNRAKTHYHWLIADIQHEFQGTLRALREHLPQFLKSIGYLSSTRVQPGRDFENITSRDVNFDVNGGASWEWLAGENAKTRERLNRWFAELHERDGRGLAKYQFGVSYDLNRNLAEEIIETETHNYLMEKHQEHEEARVRFRDDYAAMESYAFPFDHLDATEITARIMKAIEAKRRATTHRRLTIQDGRSNTEVTAADIGVGIQFLIPVLVEMLSGGAALKIIEEPELHAHPALQAELGDALIEGALRDQRTSHSSRFLIETHSEHLILRILRRIREASEDSNRYPERLPRVRPEDVAVIYAEPSSEGTILHHLKITDDGDFIDRWPAGFFTERADELF